MGKHYKYAAYEKVYGDKGQLIEGLSDPGKESVLVEIPGIGCVMSSICRDISNRDWTERMARIFHVDFLIVPAWSPSLHHAFENQLQSITEANMNTCAVVCNCCAPTSVEYPEKGLVVTPYKKGSRIIGKSRMICVKKLSLGKCKKCAGCIFCLTLSFQTQDVEKGKISRSIRRYML